MELRIGKTTYDVTWPYALSPTYVRGRINFTRATIEIAQRTGTPLRKRSNKGLQHTFWHEVVHGILQDMGSRKYRDEYFVDELAKRIGQVHAQLPVAERGV